MSGSETVTRLFEVTAQIESAAQQAGRSPSEVNLVAVSKTFGAEAIVPALEAGHRVFGENRVQEARDKWPALKDTFEGVRLHLIGPLQTNKVRDALRLFSCIETVDRLKLARAIAKELNAGGQEPELFIQVNTGEEEQKAGIFPAEADAFISQCRDDLELPVSGLMCIPPFDEEPSLHFALLAKIAERNGITNLSMGMSADFETAIAFGATHVRVGSAIFGTRPAH